MAAARALARVCCVRRRGGTGSQRHVLGEAGDGCVRARCGSPASRAPTVLGQAIPALPAACRARPDRAREHRPERVADRSAPRRRRFALRRIDHGRCSSLAHAVMNMISRQATSGHRPIRSASFGAQTHGDTLSSRSRRWQVLGGMWPSTSASMVAVPSRFRRSAARANRSMALFGAEADRAWRAAPWRSGPSVAAPLGAPPQAFFSARSGAGRRGVVHSWLWRRQPPIGLSAPPSAFA